jgi:hypothetical protein
MNTIYPTPKGFVLVTDEDMGIPEVERMVHRLHDVTGVTWVIIPKTKADEDAKYIALGKRFEETLKKMTASTMTTSKAMAPAKARRTARRAGISIE